MTLYGIDIAKYQAGLSLAEVQREGFSWVEARCSTGFRGQPIDPDFAEFKAEAQRVGLPLVAYHFLYRGSVVPIATQVADCVRAIGDPSVPVMIDHETADNTGIPSLRDAIHFAVGMSAHGYRVPLWYLPHWVWQGLGSPDLPMNTGMTLVSSSYVAGKGYASSLYPGSKAAGWAGYGGLTPGIFQFTDQALVAGKYVDADAFEGTVAQLHALLGGGPAPSPRPTPAPVPAPVPVPRPTPAPASSPSGKDHRMFVFTVASATLPAGTAWPGDQLFAGGTISHIEPDANGVSNLAGLLKLCGQTEPVPVTYAQYQRWGGK